MKMLLLMSEKTGAMGRPQDDCGDCPLTDAEALTEAFVGPEDSVDVLDPTAASQDASLVVRLARRIGGPHLALALMAFRRRRRYDVFFSDSEALGMPLAVLFAAVNRRPIHLTMGHRLSRMPGRRAFALFGLHRQIDTLFVQAQAQRDFAEDHLGVPPERITLLPPPVDDRFFRSPAGTTVRPELVCTAGLRARDYPLLREAVAGLPGLTVQAALTPGVHVDLAAVPPGLPPGPVRAPGGFAALRRLYAESLFVAVPLCETDGPAGATAILQGMAMGKAVIATRTEGQADMIVDGVTGLSVAPGDVAGWQHAITRLRDDAALRERLGRNARRWVEEHAAQDRWARRVVEAISLAASAQELSEIDPFPTPPASAGAYPSV